jgi:hypothetical protein
MKTLFTNIEMRSVIALVAVLGSIGLAYVKPEYGVATVSILGNAVGGYYALSTPKKEEE